MVRQGFFSAWDVFERGIVYLNFGAEPGPTIEFFDFATGEVGRLAVAEGGGCVFLFDVTRRALDPLCWLGKRVGRVSGRESPFRGGARRKPAPMGAKISQGTNWEPGRIVLSLGDLLGCSGLPLQRAQRTPHLFVRFPCKELNLSVADLTHRFYPRPENRSCRSWVVTSRGAWNRAFESPLFL